MQIDFIVIFHAVLKTVIPVIAGIIAEKIGMFDKDFSKKLSSIVLKICQPVLIITSILSVEYSKDNLITGLTVLLAALVAHILLAIIGFGSTYGFKRKDEGRVAQFCIMFSNIGFFGFPVIKILYGSTGLFWGGFYYIVFNIVMWSYGNYILAKANPNSKINPLKIFVNAGTVPVVIGFAMYLLRVQIYTPVFEALESLGDVCTPVSMLIIGAMLSRGSLKKMFTTLSTWHSVFIKMIIVPIVVGTVIHLVGFNDDITIFTTVMVSLPTATAAAMFAEVHGVYPETAAQNVGIATLVSVLTVPSTVTLVSKIIEII